LVEKLGKNVPQDIQIIGFDNIKYSNLVIPAITTINQPIKKMGELALETLIKLLNDEQLEEFHQILDVEIIERESTIQKD